MHGKQRINPISPKPVYRNRTSHKYPQSSNKISSAVPIEKKSRKNHTKIKEKDSPLSQNPIPLHLSRNERLAAPESPRSPCLINDKRSIRTLESHKKRWPVATVPRRISRKTTWITRWLEPARRSKQTSVASSGEHRAKLSKSSSIVWTIDKEIRIINQRTRSILQILDQTRNVNVPPQNWTERSSIGRYFQQVFRAKRS